MIHVDIPALVKIYADMRGNVSLAVSCAIDYDQPQYELKPDVRALKEEGKLSRSLIESDYEVVGKADTVSFWFIGGTSLIYRVGVEITRDDFDRIKADLSQLEFKGKKNDRGTSTGATHKEAE